MISQWRQRIVYFVLLPAITIAACILGYFTWRTTSAATRLGERTIAEATLLLVREKVDIIEQYVIQADREAFQMVHLASPDAVDLRFRELGDEVIPSVHALALLDDSGNPVVFSTRGATSEARAFRKVFFERIMPDLELERERVGRLRHHHVAHGRRDYLISYRVRRHNGRRWYLIASHDTDFIVREQFPSLFATEEGKRSYNVVDRHNQIRYGRSLAQAGDYVVGHRFPTTLYNWRLQVAPKQAPRLEAQARSRVLNEVALIGTSLMVILLGAAFLLYAADKERRLNALKSEFIANVSHELKTPLSVIRMFGEMLLSRRVRNENKRTQYLEIICRESERLSTLIENVLDFAALERGKRKYDLRRGNLAEVIEGAIETFRYRMEKEGVEVRFFPPGSEVVLSFDEQALVLGVINLLDNAAKFGDGLPIDVHLESKERWVEVRVRDRGPGIKPEDRRRIFDRFYRGGSTRAVRGSGIGLSLVKHIAEAHGGKAWASAASGGGALVSFSIPLPKPGSEPQKKQAESGSLRTSATTSRAEVP
ncbi:MAG: HAMP domain-containing sensor histidine kinase [Myxococcota bacterium]